MEIKRTWKVDKRFRFEQRALESSIKGFLSNDLVSRPVGFAMDTYGSAVQLIEAIAFPNANIMQ